MGGTMIALRGRSTAARLQAPQSRSVWLLSAHGAPEFARASQAVIIEAGAPPPPGVGLYICKPGASPPDGDVDFVEVPAALAYLGPGDIISLSQGGAWVRTLW